MIQNNGKTASMCEALDWKSVGNLGGFWGERQQICLDVTLPIEYQRCLETGRVEALKIRPNTENALIPHRFWDSDIAKWIEAVAYSLVLRRDAALENKVDEIVDMIEDAQQPDGYFNSYYAAMGLENRFTYLKLTHELYCLGHMIEGAVAYFRATGKRRLLDVVCRYADLVDSVFGAGENQLPGYDGHEEIELALVKLYHATGEERYLRMSRYFVDQRGQEPNFFDAECERRGETVEDRRYRYDKQGNYAYYQAHMPVREQKTAVGHAVRATYLYCAMADLAAETGDAALRRACENLWKDIAHKQLFITGGIGSNANGERFTYDYNLPNEMAYNETCASIGLFLFAHRLMRINPRGEYGDVMERCLFNNIAGGTSRSGDRFFYANSLAALPDAYQNMNDYKPQITLERQEWFDVACCPPNWARLMMSLGGYVYYQAKDALYVNQYINSSAKLDCANDPVEISQEGNYPWDGVIKLTIKTETPREFGLKLRLPKWSRGNYRALVNGEAAAYEIEDGFLSIHRLWQNGDQVLLELDMRLRVSEARPEVGADCGRIALERGPLVYCLEEADNGVHLQDLRINTETLTESFEKDLLGGVVLIRGKAARRINWPEDDLYRDWNPAETTESSFTALPFYARLNRKPGEMIVWALPAK